MQLPPDQYTDAIASGEYTEWHLLASNIFESSFTRANIFYRCEYSKRTSYDSLYFIYLFIYLIYSKYI